MPSLIIENLMKSFDGEPVLNRLNLTFETVRSYCLMAPSGAGKTTLFHILMGLETPDGGTITGLEGKRFSAVFQEDRLLEGYTALQNIRLVTGSRYSPAELTEILLRLLPEDALRKPVREFSGGMKRRTVILRALLSPSDILLMDEPFTGLDPETKRSVIAIIKEYRQDRLLIVATHSEEDAGLLGAEIVRLDA